jgi:16S rRNA C1402 (ribose-2'-O) methylase RsmI
MEAITHAQTVDPRGEYVLVLAPNETEQIDVTDEVIREELSQRTANGLSKRDAIDEVTAALGVARKRVYALAVES